MTPFLRQVAQAYAEHERNGLTDYCFVFPNKRSATFFAHHLDAAMGEAYILPEITTITRLVAQMSPWDEATRYEQLMVLYEGYRSATAGDVSYDSFLFWGEMLMSDFNDVDRFMVDAEALFTNVERLREISSDYLTEEQREIIARYWGDEADAGGIERFWRHVGSEKEGDTGSPRGKFVKIWGALLPMYRYFTRKLKELNIASQGMMYRHVAESISDLPELPYKRYVFVGFNVLTVAEIKIFKELQRRGVADYYWDFNSPAFTMAENKAGRFIRRNMKEFPSRYPLDEEPITQFPKIDIVGVPSMVGQAKIAGRVIDRMAHEGAIKDTSNAVDTAVVLPDESLFIPMIHSIPEVITSMNVTMGFPMRLSPIAGLIHRIVSMQLRGRENSSGERSYFHDDVRSLLQVPMIRDICPNEVTTMTTAIRSRRLFMVPAALLVSTLPLLERIFTPVKENDSVDSVAAYVEGVLQLIESNSPQDELQRNFIQAYRDAVAELTDACRQFGVTMRSVTFFTLIERAVGGATINFTGEPLHGLQIMGVLETRALDFDNVIVLSMNERIFPRKLYSRSFIPEALRRGYGLSTIDFQESIFAYYFYRLIARARRVTLIYDGRTVGGIRSNEISRYLAQLLYVYPSARISHTLAVFSSQRFDGHTLSINKDEAVMERLRRYCTAGSGKCLSASAINQYINCPMWFYLEKVEDFSVEDEIVDYMDSSTFGQVFHETAQRVYEQMRGEAKQVTVTRDMLQGYCEPTDLRLDRIITRAINVKYLNLKPNDADRQLAGENLVLARVIKRAITGMLRADMDLTPFEFINAEMKMEGQLQIAPDLTVNVKQYVDRIDEVNGVRRFVDYKTGEDPLRASSIEDLFITERTTKRPKAILQLLLYCIIYRGLYGDDRAITPVIYSMHGMVGGGTGPTKVAGEEILDYHSVAQEFTERISATIREIFDPTVPFTQATNKSACTFCKFKPICGRDR